MLGAKKERHVERLVPVALDAYVPADNLYRQIEAKLDLTFVRDWVGDRYADRGRPSIDPVVFFKLQLILFFEGCRSERKLMDMARLHLAQRWYLGYALDEPLPDHSSLTRIRTRLGVDIFQRFFDRVVELCQEAGLVWGKELFFDGTKVRANADIDSLTPRFAQQAREHVAELFASDGASVPGEPSSVTPSASATPSSKSIACAAPTERAALGATTTPTPLPFTGPPALEQQLAQENAGQWKLLEHRRLNPKRPPSGPYRRITDFRVSTTDPDAAPMTTGAAAKLG